MDGYCSDITRCVFLGEPPAEVAEAYAVLHEAQRAAVLAGTRRHAVRGGRSRRPTDHRRRRVRRATSSTAPATASAWRSTRTRTWSRATSLPLEPGHAFSVEPGIYLPGRWGMRLEDIVVATDVGPLAVNDADHGLVSVAA